MLAPLLPPLLRPDPAVRAFSTVGRTVIARPDRVTIYAVEPARLTKPSRLGFRGAVAARSLLPAEGRRATAALIASLRSASPTDTMSCFEPHHGLKFFRRGNWVAAWICYKCHRIQIEESGGRESMLPIGRAGRSVLDELLPKGNTKVRKRHFGT